MLWLNEFGSWLVHSAVFGAILLLFGGLAVRLCREPLYRIRIIHWTFVACLLVPVLQQVDLTPSYSLDVWQEPKGVNTSQMVAAHDFESPASASAQPDNAAVATETTLAKLDPTIQNEASFLPAASPPQAAKPAPNNLAFLPIAIRVVQVAYLALVGYLLCTWGVALVRRSIIVRHAKPADKPLRSVLASIAGPRAQYARLLISDGVDSSITWGLWRPTIVVPAQLAAAKDSAELRWGLAHEWSHVVRRDFSKLLLASLAKFVCFYQPVYWWLRRQLTLSQDYLADAFAAKHGDSAEDYAAFLVSGKRRRKLQMTPS
jgi:beta-lactamase regulating signal transducer with metallopeptidase domain